MMMFLSEKHTKMLQDIVDAKGIVATCHFCGIAQSSLFRKLTGKVKYNIEQTATIEKIYKKTFPTCKGMFDGN